MRVYRAGETVEDICRACKLDRLHTVIVADSRGVPVRVQCDYCGSQHQYRGGPADRPRTSPAGQVRAPARAEQQPFEIVSERERSSEALMVEPVRAERSEADLAGGASGTIDVELLLRRIIREEAGVTPVVPAEKWRGGTVLLKPGNPSLQEKSWPVEAIFHKIVMIRNRLRSLEQQVNASDLPDDAKIKLQGYITGCYGSLTSFNVLFANEDDQFKGSGE